MESLFVTVGSVTVIVLLTAMTAYFITRVKTGKVLFSHLREMDRKKMDLILIEFEKTEGFGIALYNRLLKASGGNIFEVKL